MDRIDPDLSGTPGSGTPGPIVNALFGAVPAPVSSDPTVHVFYVDLRKQRHLLTPFGRVLSDAERARASRYAFGYLSERFVLRRGLLRHLIGHWRGMHAGKVEFVANRYGKPACADGDAPHFNISDCEDDTVFALSWQHPVGIDVERRRDMDDADALAADVFSPRDLSAYRELEPGRRHHAFLRGWTSKEAVLKAIGTGLSTPLASFDVEIDPGKRPQLLRIDGDDAAAWSMCALHVAKHLHVTLAARTRALQTVSHTANGEAAL